jgi:hypothetical protein
MDFHCFVTLNMVVASFLLFFYGRGKEDGERREKDRMRKGLPTFTTLIYLPFIAWCTILIAKLENGTKKKK